MGNARTFFVPVAAVFLLAFFTMHAWAGEKVSIVEYALKAVAAVDSGKYIKTEWNAKVRNGAPEPVHFSLTILFVDSDNKILKESTSQCELQAHETKSFKDTVLVEADIAKKIASTRAVIEEAKEESAAP